VIKQLADAGIFSLLFTGGEPLIRKDIKELINYAINKKLITSINTNGLLVNKNNIKTLSKMWWVKISIDTFDKEKNDFFRGKEGYTKKAINSIKLLKRNKAKVAVQTTLSKFNIKEVEKILENTKKLGAVQYFSFFIPYGRGEKIKDILIDKEELKRFFNYIKNRKEKYPKIIIHYPLSFLVTKENKNVGSGCPLGNFGVSIEADGTVLPCPYWKRSLGNIKTESFKRIWKKWKNSKLCKDLLNSSKLKGKCLNCKYKDMCKGGCRALSGYLKKDMYLPDPLCFR